MILKKTCQLTGFFLYVLIYNLIDLKIIRQDLKQTKKEVSIILVLNQYQNHSKSNIIFSIPLSPENANYLYPLFYFLKYILKATFCNGI